MILSLRNLSRSLRLLSLLVLICIGWPTLAPCFELEPLTTRNLAPAVIGFGLPALGSARLLQPQSGRVQASFDIVSNFAINRRGVESLNFDGETYRLALAVDYGLGQDFEVGVELPLLSHGGGFLDGFIENWHDLFGLPQAGRDRTEPDQFDYSYSESTSGFGLQSETAGIGDLSLRGAWQFWRDRAGSRSLALRTRLKIPTGSAEKLTGSGSTDLALWLSGEQRLATAAGALLVYGGAGALLSSDGELLADRRRNLAGLLSLGFGWQPWSRVGLQLQFDGHTPLFKGSELRELNQFAGQLAIGGSIALGKKTVLELAVVEDVVVNTAPDAVFHLALRREL